MRGQISSLRADFRPKRTDLRPERTDFRPERAAFRPEKADSKPERVDFRCETAWGNGPQFLPLYTERCTKSIQNYFSLLFNSIIINGPTDGWTNGPMDQRTKPLSESRVRNLKKKERRRK